ncbi:DNA-3-methyladenine glycosylase I [bacterium]|nr:DNA-3-methyladenine glycosylase I [bacterium]
MNKIHRCEWARSETEIEYHDKEWGAPLHDDQMLFEFLILEGAQAGLSWSTILNKRPHYRIVFDQFDPNKVARYSSKKIEKLIADPGIVRNRLKVNSAVQNAKAILKVQEEFGSFDQYIWGFVDGAPIQNKWKSLSEIPANTPLSDAISKDLKKRGFNFVGTTILYAFMQAVGMVNDHTVKCFRHNEVKRLSKG